MAFVLKCYAVKDEEIATYFFTLICYHKINYKRGNYKRRQIHEQLLALKIILPNKNAFPKISYLMLRDALNWIF